jgi:mannosyltransferase
MSSFWRNLVLMRLYIPIADLRQNVSENRSFLSTLFILTAVAAGLRFYHLAFQSFWMDEAMNVLDASKPLSKISQSVLASPSLYHYFLHGVLQFTGRNDFLLRLPSAIVGTLTIPAAYCVFYSIYNRRAFIPVLLWAFSPFHIRYSQEARMYAFVALLSLGSLYFWLKTLETDRKKYWAALVLFECLGLYTHYWFFYVVGVQFLWLAAEIIYNKRSLQRWLVGVSVIAATSLTLLPRLFEQIGQNIFEFNRKPPLILIGETIDQFCGFFLGAPTEHQASLESFFVSAIVIVLLFGAFRSTEALRKCRIFFGGFLLPILGGLMVSILYKPFYNVRYAIVSLPAFYLLMVPAFTNQGRFSRVCSWLAVVWIGLLARPLAAQYTDPYKGDFRDLRDYISAHTSKTSAISISNLPQAFMITYPLLYYMGTRLPFIPGFKARHETDQLFCPVHDFQRNEEVHLIPKEWTIAAETDFLRIHLFVLRRQSVS